MTLKRLYIYLSICFAFAACISTSCSSDSTDIPADNKGSEVTFDVKDLTRASAITSFNQFVVYGDRKFTKESEGAPAITFNKTLVEYSDGSWSYRDVQYWINDHEHSFVAIYPLSVLETGNNPQYANSELSFTYTLPLADEGSVDENGVADIVAATYRRIYNESSPASTVSLSFFHLLSQLNFLLELTDPFTRSEECFKIHKLEISGFGTSAAINIKPAALQSNTQTNDSEIDIVIAKGNGSLTVSFDQPIEVINGAAPVKMFGGNNAIIMLPQTFAADAALKISLTYSVNDEAEEKQVSTTLSSCTWEYGKSYNYNIKLELEEPKEANMVINNATIAPWTLVDDHANVDAW